MVWYHWYHQRYGIIGTMVWYHSLQAYILWLMNLYYIEDLLYVLFNILVCFTNMWLWQLITYIDCFIYSYIVINSIFNRFAHWDTHTHSMCMRHTKGPSSGWRLYASVADEILTVSNPHL